MKIMTASDVRNNFARVLDQVVDDAEPVAIPRSGDAAVIIVDKTEWDSMVETLYLLGNRRNARQLLDSMDEIDLGNVVEVDLDTLRAAGSVPRQRTADDAA